MQTNNFLTRFYNKKVVSFVEWRDRFLYWARDAVYDLRKAFLKSSLLSPVAVSAAGNNAIVFAAAGDVEGYDPGGEKIRVPLPALGTVGVPPQAGVTWSVGLRQSLVESGVEINPRTGQPEYETYQHVLGVVGAPDELALVGGKIRLRVSGVLHGQFGASSHDYTGRQVRVWLKAKDVGGLGPVSAIASVAFETRPVFFSGSENWVELVETLGQPSGSLSVDPTKYVVMALGPVVVEGELYPDIALPICHFQNVAGGNPITSFNHSVQRVVSITLADLADVVRLDEYGRAKIRVRAHGNDDDDDQLRVESPAGAHVLKVVETGLFRTGVRVKHLAPATPGEPTFAAGIPFGSTTGIEQSNFVVDHLGFLTTGRNSFFYEDWAAAITTIAATTNPLPTNAKWRLSVSGTGQIATALGGAGGAGTDGYPRGLHLQVGATGTVTLFTTLPVRSYDALDSILMSSVGFNSGDGIGTYVLAIGLSTDPLNYATSDGVFMRTSNGANWDLVTRASGAQTATGSGVAPTVNHQHFRLEKTGDSSARLFLSSSGTFAQTASATNIGFGHMYFFVMLSTSGGVSSKTAQLGEVFANMKPPLVGLSSNAAYL